MSAVHTNRALAAEILSVLRGAGIRTICLCPGGRNAPLVLACEAADKTFEVVSFFEERSASFFALGRIRRDAAPVAVITTSGTAAAELLPAMLEAAHAGLPLIAVTADRPRHLRGTGAPQTIDQPPLFAAAKIPVIDIDQPGELGSLSSTQGPVHINVCFDEPLVEGPLDASPLSAAGTLNQADPWMNEKQTRDICADFFRNVRHPLVMVPSLDPVAARGVAPWLASLECPLYLEAVSQLRGHRDLQEFSLHSGERILLSSECRAACDGVVRIGGVPTPRFWRQAEDWRVLHISPVNLPGMGNGSPVIPLDVFTAIASDFSPDAGNTSPLFERDRSIANSLQQLLESEPRSEAGLVRALSERLAANARILLGNSLPIREWDLAAQRAEDERTIFANRGVNGIDGLVSTALGLAGSDRPAAGVIGDLSALYDLAGLWPAAQLGDADVTLAVINNAGGKIFDRMFRSAVFLNAHQLRLRGWAEMFGWHYATIHGPSDPFPPGTPRLLEVLPDEEATRRFADGYAALWR